MPRQFWKYDNDGGLRVGEESGMYGWFIEFRIFDQSCYDVYEYSDGTQPVLSGTYIRFKTALEAAKKLT